MVGSEGLTAFFARFRSAPVVAAIRTEEHLRAAIDSAVQACFFLTGNPLNLPGMVRQVKQARKLACPHLDLLEGVASDRYGIKYLASLGVDGVITTRTHLVQQAKAEGLLAIQRLFLLDSGSLRTGARVVQESAPDAVEVLPGLLYPLVAEAVRKVIHVPIIAGGFIRTADDARSILKAGAIAVSTSTVELWTVRELGGVR